MASMALMPVCMGSCTGLRPMMPGAWISIRRGCTPTSGPLPSMGSPSAFTTRPNTPSPTGTERIWPVALTVWPSSMRSESPNTTAPMASSSRFNAKPLVPSSNSSNSFTAQSGRPEMRAIPSPTSTTRPTVRASSEGVKPSRFFLIADAMSAADSVSSAMSFLVPFFQAALRADPSHCPTGYGCFRRSRCRPPWPRCHRAPRDRRSPSGSPACRWRWPRQRRAASADRR
jgi:hypothetical protein